VEVKEWDERRAWCRTYLILRQVAGADVIVVAHIHSNKFVSHKGIHVFVRAAGINVHI
jgi:hypothetical protein